MILHTDNGNSIAAGKMVYAIGYEVVQYIDKPIVKLHSTYATISKQVQRQDNFWKDNVMIWNTADPYLYLRTTKDKRILVGGRDEEFFSPPKRDKLINKKCRQLSADFKKIFPRLPLWQKMRMICIVRIP